MEKILNDYLEKIERYLKPLPISERVDIVKEIQSEIFELQSNGKNAKEISEITGYAETTVHAYLPRVRPAYNENISENAKRIKKYRQNK